ncbi:hypothetical protein [Polyangium sp. 15x6]|uniref:hypothetical protein n=1 Tax=Polyangium sp. 15x6 TaxID=3042687 RepID=UPI002499D667|nr:hypothetical protein [Polyangium sp. 15x6]MDI3285882.1 hypothetical protein [Polyangium sp. 15x6]
MSGTRSTARYFSIVLYEFHKSRGQPTNGTRLARVDPPGLLEGWSITSVRQYFWQYLWFGVLFFHRGPERYVYVPADWVERLPVDLVTLEDEMAWRDTQSASATVTTTRLDRLLGCALRGEPGEHPWGDVVRRARGEALAADCFDFAPLLRDDLVRAADAGRMAEAFALVDVLTTFGGIGSESAVLPRVFTGAEAEALLVERLGPGAREDVCRELSMGASGAQPADGNRVFAALIDRRESFDESSGYHAELAIGRLFLSADGEAWSYEREVLWFETEEGMPYS